MRKASEDARRASEADAFGTANLVHAKFTLAENALLVLASSTLLDSGDLRTFEGMLRRVSARTGNSYVLVDPQGQQVINTALAGGASLPRTDTSRWQPVFTERRPYITDVTVGAASYHLVSIVVVPVIRDDTIKWTLSTGLYARTSLIFWPRLACRQIGSCRSSIAKAYTLCECLTARLSPDVR